MTNETAVSKFIWISEYLIWEKLIHSVPPNFHCVQILHTGQ